MYGFSRGTSCLLSCRSAGRRLSGWSSLPSPTFHKIERRLTRRGNPQDRCGRSWRSCSSSSPSTGPTEQLRKFCDLLTDLTTFRGNVERILRWSRRIVGGSGRRPVRLAPGDETCRDRKDGERSRPPTPHGRLRRVRGIRHRSTLRAPLGLGRASDPARPPGPPTTSRRSHSGRFRRAS